MPELTACPHCGGKTVMAHDTRLRWVCAACGGPRIPGAPGHARAVGSALARARVAQTAGFAWGAGALVLALTALMGTALAAILWGASHVAGGTLGALAAALLGFAWRASSRAGGRRREAKRELDAAWRDGALALLRARGGDATAAELAEEMRVDEADADALLTELGGHDRVRVEIGDEGTVRYRAEREEQAIDASATTDDESGGDAAETAGTRARRT
jgi:hypothetical protein